MHCVEVSLSAFDSLVDLTGSFILMNGCPSLHCTKDHSSLLQLGGCRSEHKHTHTHPFNGPFSGTTRVSRYQKGKTNLDFTEARDSEQQWHQLGLMQVCISLQTDNHASTTLLKVFLQAGCPSCHPTNSVKALKATVGQSIRPLLLTRHPCTVLTPIPLITAGLKRFINVDLRHHKHHLVIILHM